MAIVIGGSIAAAGAVGGAAISSKGAKDAASASSDAADRQAALQYDMYQQQREDQAPWRDAGIGALNLLQYRLGIGPGSNTDLLRKFSAEDFQTDPGYQFRLQQGQNGIESSAAARGGLLSGAAAKALTKYNQNFASNEYQNVYNRWNNDQSTMFNRLAALAGVGQTATNQLGQAGQNFATNAGNAIQYGGAARASGYTGTANSLSAGLGSLAGAGLAYGMYGNRNPNSTGSWATQYNPNDASTYFNDPTAYG